MKAGFCETDITPVLGMERPGNYGKTYLHSVHDPLKVRAAVFDDGRQRVALVGVDTCTISAQTVALARAGIEQRCKIPGKHVLIAASHTHSGGPLFGFRADEFDRAPKLVRELAVNHSTVIDPHYQRWTVGQIVTAVCEADRKKQKALLSVGSGSESAVVFNRRFRMRNGRTYTHPGKGNRDIVAPAGPVDPEVAVLGAWTLAGELLGCVVNYACHGTVGPGGLSADWICYLEQTLRGALGTRAHVVFLPGAAGDVTQVDNQAVREGEFGEKWARRVGMRIGAEAVKALVSSERGALAPIAAARKILRLKRRKPAKIAASVAAVRQIKDHRDPRWVFAKERIVLDYLYKKQPVADIEVQAIQIGPVVFVSNPAEYFCQFGLEIKRRSAFPRTCVVSLANGAAGYVPTEDAFAPGGGGYETVLTSYSHLEIAAGRKIAAASIELTKAFKPRKMPAIPGPRAGEEFKPTPWEYGVLGPELE